jgi:hypothetical protein
MIRKRWMFSKELRPSLRQRFVGLFAKDVPSVIRKLNGDNEGTDGDIA